MTTQKAIGAPPVIGGKQAISSDNAISATAPAAIHPGIAKSGTSVSPAPLAISLTGTSSTVAKPSPIIASTHALTHKLGATSTASSAGFFPASSAPIAPAKTAPTPMAIASAAKTEAPVKQGTEPMTTPSKVSQKTEHPAITPAKPKSVAASKAPTEQKTPVAAAPVQKSVSKADTLKDVAAKTKTPTAITKAAPIKAAKAEATSAKSIKSSTTSSAQQSMDLSSSTSPSRVKDSNAKPVISPVREATQAGLSKAQHDYASLHEQSELWTRGLSAGLSVASRGTSELHGKMLDLVCSQTDSTLNLWRQLLSAGSMAEAVELQTRELRRQFESSSKQMKDIVQTSNRLWTEALTSSLHPRD